jgi:hypothetical protein
MLAQNYLAHNFKTKAALYQFKKFIIDILKNSH